MFKISVLLMFQILSVMRIYVSWEIWQFCKLQDEGQSLMRVVMTQHNLSAKAYYRILKLLRTMADLAGSEDIQSAHLEEALQYRLKLLMEKGTRGLRFCR